MISCHLSSGESDGNIAAGAFAERVVQLRPGLPPDFASRIEDCEEQSDFLVRLAAAVLPCYEQGERWQRLPVFSRGRTVTGWGGATGRGRISARSAELVLPSCRMMLTIGP